MKFPTLYKRTTTGAVQQWTMEVEDNKFRTISGQVNGKMVITPWTECFGKNVGKANETTDAEQAVAEATAKFTKQKEKHYRENIENIDTDKYFKVMLAKAYKSFSHKLNNQVYSQPKLDGIRCVVNKSGMFAGRSGKDIVSAPHIFEDMANFLNSYSQEVIFDGELYADSLADDFEKLVSLAKKTKPTAQNLTESREGLEYHIYDVFFPESPNLSFQDRQEKLKDIFDQNLFGQSIKMVDTEQVLNQEHMDDLYGQYLANGQEGQMLRNGESSYQGKRTHDLLKRKEFLDDEFEIIEVNEGKGTWAGVAKSLKFRMKDGTEFDAGIKGNYDYCQALLENATRYVGKQATVRYQNLTSAGIPRFPIVYCIHETERW